MPIYNVFEAFLLRTRMQSGWYFLDTDRSSIFVNMGTVDKISQQSGKQDFFKQLPQQRPRLNLYDLMENGHCC